MSENKTVLTQRPLESGDRNSNETGNDPFVDFLGEWALLALKSTNRSLPVSLCTGLADDDFLEEIQHCRKEAEIGSPLKTLKVSTIF